MELNYLYLILIILVVVGIAGAVIFSSSQRRRKRIPPFTQALTLLLSGESEKALEKLRQVVKEDTDNIQAYILYGNTLRDLGRYSQAVKIHKELTIRSKLKPEVMNDIYRSLLQDYQSGGYLLQALACADELLSRNKKDLWTLQQKLEVLEQVEDWKEASETVRRIQTLSGKTDDGLLALYKLQEGRHIIDSEGREHDGRLRFRAALKLDRGCAWAYLEMADSYIREGRPDDAIKEWKELFQNNPRLSYLAFEKLEKTAFEQGRFEELESIYNRLLEAEPKNSRCIVASARFLERKGEIAQAVRILREGLESAPESLWIRRNLFRLLATNNQFAEAMEVGLEVIEMVTHEKEDFICGSCGYIAHKPMWYCPECRKWRTFRF